MIKSQNSKKGFTILEILVVLAIAGMILSFTIVNIRETRKRSRDSRREEDIKQIQNALNIYANNNRKYPICSTEVVISSLTDTCVGPILVADMAFGAGQPPSDPMSATSGTCGETDSYGYCYRSINGSTYELRYSLETDSIPIKNSGWQPIISP